MKIHVGNLNPNTQTEDLEKMFGTYGPVTSVNIIPDNDTGNPQCYAFIEMANYDDGIQAIQKLNQQEINGNTIIVTEAPTNKKATVK